MKYHRNALLLLAVIAFGCVAASEVIACQCVETLDKCYLVGRADAIFVGKVVAVKDVPAGIDEVGNELISLGDRSFVLRVEERFQGVKSLTVEIPSGASNCDLRFQLGERYLIYAERGEDGKFHTSVCAGSRSLDQADEDLAYLRNLPHPGIGGTIRGMVIGYNPTGGGFMIGGLPGISVRINGPGKPISLFTGADGSFELSGLKPGKYGIKIQLPDHYEQDDLIHGIKVSDRGCARDYFVAHVNNGLTGTLVDKSGKPLANTHVELISAGEHIPGWYDSDEQVDTDESGRFVFEKIPPGRYLLGINLRNSPGESLPYLATYYPGVTKREDAQVIEFGLGQKLADRQIQLLGELVKHTVSGVARWPDGTPAANAHVYLGYIDPSGEWQTTDSSAADENGEFAVFGFEGFDYLLQAYAERSGIAGGAAVSAHAIPPKFDLKGDRDAITLILSLPGTDCEQCERPKPNP
ncbi:MAG: carboxypeptidase regulatory-like domain-containing protein [Pyrinomonadaceae bacterium]